MTAATHLRALMAGCLLALSSSSGRSAEGAALDSIPGDLRAAIWRASVFGEEASGSACWLRGPAGELRLEVARLPDSRSDEMAWGRLLGRGGEGWTCVIAGDAAVGGRWGRPYESVPGGTRTRIEVLLAVLAGGPGGWSRGLPAGVRLLPPDGEPAARRRPTVSRAEPRPVPADGLAGHLHLADSARLRDRLAVRGRGRGGEGETWTVRWEGAERGGGACLRIWSSRLSGHLQARPVTAVPVLYTAEELFFPLWSLAELLTFPDGRPESAGALGPAAGAD